MSIEDCFRKYHVVDCDCVDRKGKMLKLRHARQEIDRIPEVIRELQGYGYVTFTFHVTPRVP